MQGIGTAERFSNSVNQKLMYVALRIDDDGWRAFRFRPRRRATETCRAATGCAEESDPDQWLDHCRHFVVLGFLLVRQFTMPITKMTEGASRIARGDYDFRLAADP
ncbi:MAG: hypothetical protein U5O39_17295 [Gammaproteobacteria bacterium]|nr:hypothetical protein [Gammaproteobacteria bacterium]